VVLPFRRQGGTFTTRPQSHAKVRWPAFPGEDALGPIGGAECVNEPLCFVAVPEWDVVVPRSEIHVQRSST